jgi:UDP-glucose 4-epimerase
MMGRPTIGVPQQTAPLVATLVRRAHLLDFSADQLDALTYGRGMDASRFTEATGFTPARSSRDAVTEFAASVRPGLLNRDRVDRALNAVSTMLRSSTAAPGPGHG